MSNIITLSIQCSQLGKVHQNTKEKMIQFNDVLLNEML